MTRVLTALAGCAVMVQAASAQYDLFTDFESISSTDFWIGAPPNSARFTGGESTSDGDPELRHSGVFSWLVRDNGVTGVIDLRTPAEILNFWGRDSVGSVKGRLELFGTQGNLLDSVDFSTSFLNYDFQGLGPITRVELSNVQFNNGESSVIDDFGADVIARINDAIPGPIPLGRIRIDLEPLAEQLRAPMAILDPNDDSGRLFIMDQSGVALVLQHGQVLPTPLLDVTGRLVDLGVFGTGDQNDYDERGLIGMALHTGFADPQSPGYHRLYTYTSEPLGGPADFTTESPPPSGREFDHQSVIAEWLIDTNDPDRIDPSTRRELFRVDQPQYSHNGGTMRFDNEGLLYISFGDGGGVDDEDGQQYIGGTTFGHGPTGNGQNTSTIHGSIVRINPLGDNSANGNYGIPPDNPFVSLPGLNEIYVYGVRNPFGWSFDPSTGELIIGDVGQNTIEEVSRAGAGSNLGWRLKEGSFRFIPGGTDDGFVTDNLDNLPPDLVDPLFEYDHDEGIAVIGGIVYQGEVIPSLAGAFVFGDFRSKLLYMDLLTGEAAEFVLGPTGGGTLNERVKGFGVDKDGEVYVAAATALGPFGNTGVVYRIVPACLADYNADGSVNTQDVLAFLNDWNAQRNGGCDPDTEFCAADITADGMIDTRDLLAFLNFWNAGCP